MSKKKVFSGSTMTLKDFHGGSIPSDVSLPSAPGLIVRPTDRPIFDRQNVWGNSIGAGRSDHRLRPRSSSSVRNLDDSKTLFLSSSVNIGRNFDEDERKPLGGGGPPPPHRTVSDESFGGSAMLLEPRVHNRKISVQSNLGQVGAQIGGISESSYSARVVEGGQSGVGVSSRPNVWGARKEVNGVGEVVSSTRSRQSLVSEFAQASALDKISSGRWQTKPVQNMVEVEVIRPLESPNSFYGWEKDSYVDGGVCFMSKRCLGIEVNRGSFNAMHSGGERAHSPAQNSVLFTNEGKPASPDATFGASELPQPPEVSERPKLKLLPRTKPLEVEEAPVVVHSQGSQQQIDTIHSEAASVFENPRHVIARPSSSEATHRKPGVSGSEAEQRAVERPKLNLKPCSQPVNHSDESTEIERKALFGGARPREMVLKERGVDDVVTSYDKAQAPRRINGERAGK